jgi:Arc/MetJ-type ribon-helix-helix transcriptional regulator
VTALNLCRWQRLTYFANQIDLQGVKPITINISLNRELADFARADAEAAAYDSMSEYMRDLIRRRRGERIAQDVATLENAISGAPSRDPSDAEMKQIYAAIKKGRKK